MRRLWQLFSASSQETAFLSSLNKQVNYCRAITKSATNSANKPFSRLREKGATARLCILFLLTPCPVYAGAHLAQRERLIAATFMR
jgi:hypothetical protein